MGLRIRASARAFLTALIGVLLCSACGLTGPGDAATQPSSLDGTPSPTPPSSRSASPSPTLPSTQSSECFTKLSTYRLGIRRTGAVTAADERVVASALRLARRHFDVRVPKCEPGNVSASVLDRTNDQFAAGTFVSAAPHFRIEIYAGGRAWARTPPAQVPLTILHEWYHVLQHSLLSCDPPRCRVQPGPIPGWLIEGGAEFAAVQAARDERLPFSSLLRRSELDRAAQVHIPLQRIHEIRTSAEYGLAFAAVELLVRRADPDALMRFWRRAGSSGSWERAFADAFGTTPARFYRAFAAYRARGFRT